MRLDGFLGAPQVLVNELPGSEEQKSGWVWLWLPISWPACCHRARDGRQPLHVGAALEEGGRHAVAGQDVENRGVLSLGPSSKVSAIDRRSRGPCQTDGPKTCEDRPRTAQAMPPVAAETEAMLAMAFMQALII